MVQHRRERRAELRVPGVGMDTFPQAFACFLGGCVGSLQTAGLSPGSAANLLQDTQGIVLSLCISFASYLIIIYGNFIDCMSSPPGLCPMRERGSWLS